MAHIYFALNGHLTPIGTPMCHPLSGMSPQAILKFAALQAYIAWMRRSGNNLLFERIKFNCRPYTYIAENILFQLFVVIKQSLLQR